MKFLHPQTVVENNLGFLKGLYVIETNPASGYFTPHLRTVVGDYGLVVSNYEDLQDKADAILSVSSFDFNSGYQNLKPDGIFIVIVWNNEYSESEMILKGELSGFTHQRKIPVGDYHHGLIFKKP